MARIAICKTPLEETLRDAENLIQAKSIDIQAVDAICNRIMIWLLDLALAKAKQKKQQSASDAHALEHMKRLLIAIPADNSVRVFYEAFIAIYKKMSLPTSS